MDILLSLIRLATAAGLRKLALQVNYVCSIKLDEAD